MTAPSSARFAIRAVADPQTVPRLLNYFAQQGLTPSDVAVRERDGALDVAISQRGIAEPSACIIAEKMRASLLVEQVSLAFAV